MLMQNHGILRLQAPCPLRDQLSWLPREDTSAGCMAYMAQPSFPIAPDSSGHQFYPARLLPRNPLKRTSRTAGFLQTGVRDGATDQHRDPDAARRIHAHAADSVAQSLGARVGAAVERVPDYSVPGGR